jgi:hypothetical protein
MLKETFLRSSSPLFVWNRTKMLNCFQTLGWTQNTWDIRELASLQVLKAYKEIIEKNNSDLKGSFLFL